MVSFFLFHWNYHFSKSKSIQRDDYSKTRVNSEEIKNHRKYKVSGTPTGEQVKRIGPFCSSQDAAGPWTPYAYACNESLSDRSASPTNLHFCLIVLMNRYRLLFTQDSRSPVSIIVPTSHFIADVVNIEWAVIERTFFSTEDNPNAG